MAYPSTIDTFDSSMQGTTLVATDDHANNHRVAGSNLAGIVQTLGTTPAGTLFSAFAAADKPVRHQGGTFQQVMVGTVNLAAGTITGNIINNGTISSGVYGTPSIDFISARNAGTGIGFNQSIFPAEGTISDSAGGTFTVDARAAQIYYSVMGTAAGNRTIGTPSNSSNYQQLTFAFKTSGSANGTIVWSPIFRFSQNSGTPTLGTGVGWNYFGWRYNAIDTKWDFMGQSLNLI